MTKPVDVDSIDLETAEHCEWHDDTCCGLDDSDCPGACRKPAYRAITFHRPTRPEIDLIPLCPEHWTAGLQGVLEQFAAQRGAAN